MLGASSPSSATASSQGFPSSLLDDSQMDYHHQHIQQQSLPESTSLTASTSTASSPYDAAVLASVAYPVATVDPSSYYYATPQHSQEMWQAQFAQLAPCQFAQNLVQNMPNSATAVAARHPLIYGQQAGLQHYAMGSFSDLLDYTWFAEEALIVWCTLNEMRLANYSNMLYIW